MLIVTKKLRAICCTFILLGLEAGSISCAAGTNVVPQYSWSACLNNYVRSMPKKIATVWVAQGIIEGIDYMFRSLGLSNDSMLENIGSSSSTVGKRPQYLRTHVPRAESTVPQLIRDRIEHIRQGNYAWPMTKGILLCGPAGMGKSQLAYYIAQTANIPIMYEAAAGLQGTHCHSGVMAISNLFRRAYTWQYKEWLKHCCARLVGKQLPVKPPVILLDEIDSILQAGSGDNIAAGDEVPEAERQKTLVCLLWEMQNNPYYGGQHVIKRSERPPATYFEKVYEGTSNIIETLIQKIENKLNIVDKFGRAQRQEKLAESINSLDESAEKVAKAKAYYDIMRSINLVGNSRARMIQRKLWWQWQCVRLWYIIPCLLRWLQDYKTPALVVATTNKRPEELDPRVKEFFDVIQVAELTPEDRRAILEVHLQGKLVANDISLEVLNRYTHGMTGDNLAYVVNNAALIAIERGADVIGQVDMEQALRECRRSKRQRR